MGLFGLDANKSTSSLTQAQVTSQYGPAYGANVGKGSASSNASGTTTIGGGVKLGKNANLVINNTNTQLENSLLEGLTNISSFLAGGGSSGGEGGSSSSGLGGLLGGSNSKGGGGGKSGTGGSVEGGNITLGSGNSGTHDLLGELQDNQANHANASTDLLDQLNAGGSGDIGDVSHPHGGFNFSPSSGGNETTQGNTSGKGIVTGVVIAVITAVAVGFAVKKLKLA